MRKQRIGRMLGVLALGIGAIPASAAMARADGDAQQEARPKCFNGTHAYTFATAGGPGAYVYLNVAGGSHKGAKVITYPWSGGKGNEMWCLEPGPKGYGHRMHPYDNRNLCLDVPGGRYEKGQGLIVWDCNGRQNQTFDVLPVHTDHPFSVIGPWEKSDLKVHRGKNAVGSQVSLWPHMNSHAEWR